MLFWLVTVWFANTSFVLGGSVVSKAPSGLGHKLRWIADRGAVHKFIRSFEKYPQLSADTIVANEGNTLLHLLAQSRQAEVAEMLAYTHFASRPYDIFVKNSAGQTPIDLAHQSGHSSVVNMLEALDYTRSNPLIEAPDPLAEAVRRNDVEAFTKLVDVVIWNALKEDSNHPDVLMDGKLFHAWRTIAATNNNYMFDRLVDLVGFPRGFTAFNSAMLHDDIYIFRAYVENGTDYYGEPWAPDAYELSSTLAAGSIKIVRFLVEELGLDVNGKEHRQRHIDRLLRAAEERSVQGKPIANYIQAAELLIDKGVKLTRGDIKRLEKFGISVETYVGTQQQGQFAR